MLGARCWVLGAGCWVLGAGCWVLGARCWVLGAGCWVLDAGCCVLDAGCWCWCLVWVLLGARSADLESLLADLGSLLGVSFGS